MKTVHPVADQLEPDPLSADQVIAGSPETSVLQLSEDAAKGEVTGFWRCTPGTFRDVEAVETFLVITGRAEVEFENGEKLTVGPGDIHRFRGGEKTVWKVEETLLKVYWARA
ncbi:MAG: cupin domain-containing protein [Solirubrobacterales bacterium]|nr:cupin domain-containing protein [Solirubrobacterales bacterium]